jgi:predicted permease
MENDLDEELRFHVERETEENVRRGMPPSEARVVALRRFGGVDKTKEEVRDADRAMWLETLLQDMRYGLRSLRKSPGYAAAAILTLALGIGANTAIFSVVYGVLLQSLPYGGGDRLVRVRFDAPGAGISDGGIAPPEMQDLRTAGDAFEAYSEYHSMWFVLLGRPEPERVQTGVVSANFFDLLGVRPVLGRTFRTGEDAHGAEAVLILSHQYWLRSFGGDPNVVGRVFQMNDRPHTVIGVLPPIPGYPQENDVYMPVSACPFRSDPQTEQSRQASMLRAFARLKRGATLGTAQAQLDALAGRMKRDHPGDYPESIRLKISPLPLRDELTAQARPTFLLLSGMVGLVLLLACASVANLSLARLVRREKELALRSALGASRGRLARQLLTESLLVAACGGTLGLLLAAACRELLVRFASRMTPRAGEISIEGPVLLFTLGVSVLVGLALGLVPALSSRRSLVGALQEGRDTAAPGGAGRVRMRSFLVVAQVAISFVLLAGAGLMLRTLWKMAQIDLGFKTERVLTSRLDLNFSRYPDANARREFQKRLLDRLSTEPGIVSAALAGNLPLNERNPFQVRYRIEGRPATAPESLPQATFLSASSDYFKAIGIPVQHGRAVTAADREDAPKVAVISEGMARHVWPDEDPVGRRIGVDGNEPGQVDWLTIVGVVGDVRQYGLLTPPPDQVYLSTLQYPSLGATLFTRTTAEPRALEKVVRAAVHSIGPEQPVDRFRTLEDVHEGALASPRLTATLLVLFAGLAVAITATGIAGVIGFSVGARRREFGIRMALGALPGAVRRMVLAQGMRLVAIGLVLGLAGAFLLSRLWSGLLYDVAPTDPLTYAAVALGLALVAAAACFLPARRATSVDPMVALRSA